MPDVELELSLAAPSLNPVPCSCANAWILESSYIEWFKWNNGCAGANIGSNGPPRFGYDPSLSESSILPSSISALFQTYSRPAPFRGAVLSTFPWKVPVRPCMPALITPNFVQEAIQTGTGLREIRQGNKGEKLWEGSQNQYRCMHIHQRLLKSHHPRIKNSYFFFWLRWNYGVNDCLHWAHG